MTPGQALKEVEKRGYFIAASDWNSRVDVCQLVYVRDQNRKQLSSGTAPTFSQALVLAVEEIVRKEAEVKKKYVIELQHNGDPYGSGFTGSEEGPYGWVYRGDIGARPRWWWRNYCRKNGFKLREVR